MARQLVARRAPPAAHPRGYRWVLSHGSLTGNSLGFLSPGSPVGRPLGVSYGFLKGRLLGTCRGSPDGGPQVFSKRFSRGFEGRFCTSRWAVNF
jgi:hypothetical protein